MTMQQTDIYLRVITGMSLDEFAKKILSEHIEEQKTKLIESEAREVAHEKV